MKTVLAREASDRIFFHYKIQLKYNMPTMDVPMSIFLGYVTSLRFVTHRAKERCYKNFNFQLPTPYPLHKIVIKCRILIYNFSSLLNTNLKCDNII